MAIQRWEPFAHLRRMEEIDRLLPYMFRPFRFLPGSWDENGIVPINMYHTDDALVVKATIPGYRPEDVELTVSDGALTLKGEVKGEKDTREERYLMRESRFTSFRRTVALPKGLNTEKADASYENGVLTVTVPKSEEVRAKTLKINVKTLEGKKS